MWSSCRMAIDQHDLIDFGDAVRLGEAMTDAADALEKGTTLVC